MNAHDAKRLVRFARDFEPERPAPEYFVRNSLAEADCTARSSRGLAIALSRSGLRVASLLTPLALLVAVLATLYNLVVVIMLFSQGILPILSLLAVAFGGYLVMSQWTVFRASRS